MQLAEFLTHFQEILRKDEPLSADSRLKDIREWDSMAIMEIITWFEDKFGLSLDFTHFKGLETVADVAALCPDITQ